MKTDVIGFGSIDSDPVALPVVDVLYFANKTPILFDICNHYGEEYRVMTGSEHFRFGEKV